MFMQDYDLMKLQRERWGEAVETGGMGDADNLSVGQTVRSFGHHLLVLLRSSQTTVLAT